MKPLWSIRDVGLVEVDVGAGRGRTALALVVGAVVLGSIGVLGGRGELEEAHLADLHARPELDWQGAHVGQFQGDVPFKARIDEPGGGVGQNAQTAQGALALQACGQRRVQLDVLPGGSQNELAWMQDPGFVLGHLELLSQCALVLCRIHVGVLMVVEDPEVAVQAHVHAGGLDHSRRPRVQIQVSCLVGIQDVMVAEQHA